MMTGLLIRKGRTTSKSGTNSNSTRVKRAILSHFTRIVAAITFFAVNFANRRLLRYAVSV